MQFLSKLLRAFFTELEQKKKKKYFVRNTKDTKQPRNLEKEDRAGDIRLPEFTLYYKATVIRDYVSGTKNRNVDQ